MYKMRKLENVPNVEYDSEKKTILFAEDFDTLRKNIALNTLATPKSLGFFAEHNNFLGIYEGGKYFHGSIRGISGNAGLIATKITSTTYSPFNLDLQKTLKIGSVFLPEFFNFIRELYNIFGDNFSPDVFEITFYTAENFYDYTAKTYKTNLFGFYKTDTINKLPTITKKNLKLMTKNGDLTDSALADFLFFEESEDEHDGIAGYVESKRIYLTTEEMENKRQFYENLLDIQFLADVQNLDNRQFRSIAFSIRFDYSITK